MATLEHLILKTDSGNLIITEVDNNKYAKTLGDFPLSNEKILLEANKQSLSQVWVNLIHHNERWYLSNPLYISPELVPHVKMSMEELLIKEPYILDKYAEQMKIWENWFELSPLSSSFIISRSVI